jgi:hypothetical protein
MNYLCLREIHINGMNVLMVSSSCYGLIIVDSSCTITLPAMQRLLEPFPNWIINDSPIFDIKPYVDNDATLSVEIIPDCVGVTYDDESRIFSCTRTLDDDTYWQGACIIKAERNSIVSEWVFFWELGTPKPKTVEVCCDLHLRLC